MTVQGYAGTVWASDPTAHRVEELQFTLGEGPCHDAVRSGVPVFAPNLSGDTTDQARRSTPGSVAGLHP